MLPDSNGSTVTKPADGSYVYGLFLEGARWSESMASLVDPKAKELFSPLPMIHMLPVRNRPLPTSGLYRCPVYKVHTTLSLVFS